MKHTHFLFFAFFLLVVLLQPSAYAIEPSLKFGKPSKEELSLQHYEADTTAVAVYLIHDGRSDFTYRNAFRLITEQWVRIKVLKPQGVSYADVTIPYYAPADKDKDKDTAFGVEGCSYNLEGEEVVKTPLKRELISNERINPNYKLLKFSIPNVKVGTVIEYRYTIGSDYSVHIDNWTMQEEIPMVYNQYKIVIPNVFLYNIEFRGKDKIEVEERKVSIQGSSTQTNTPGVKNDFTILAKEYTFTSRNLPSIRQNESFCWCPEDYKVQILFDLEGTNFPGQGYKPFSREWADVDKQLLREESDDFGKFLQLNNPFLEETKECAAHANSFEERVVAAFKLLKAKLAWDGSYHLYGDEIGKVLKKGSGSNADLNFVFISILKNFGISAYPVILSRRSKGILPYNYPTIQKINTFVVAVLDAQKGEYSYLDSSMGVPVFNVLPLDLCVEKARVLSPGIPEEEKWVDLIKLCPNRLTIQVAATVRNGKIEGQRSRLMQGQYALEYWAKHQQQDSLSRVQNEGVFFSNVKTMDNKKDFTILKEEADFYLEVDTSGNRLYINPMVFPQLKENPFTQSARVLPIEFAYPYKVNLICDLKIPEGYEVEEIPQSQKIKTEDGKLSYTYLIEQNDQTISLRYMFNVNSYLFPAEHYPQLQEIWHKVIEKNQALVVLKKR